MITNKANKAYYSDMAVKNIYQSVTHKMAAKASRHRNYVIVALCIYESSQPSEQWTGTKRPFH